MNLAKYRYDNWRFSSQQQPIILLMEGSNLRKISTQRFVEGLPIKKIKRLHHIKSLPALQHESLRKSSRSKLQTNYRDDNQVKIRRFKTQQHLKPPNFGAVKTARERNIDCLKRKQQPFQPSKSLTKSTTYRSPLLDDRKKVYKYSKSKEKKSLKKIYSGILHRIKEVVQQYQLKIDRCLQQKQQILKQNFKLKNQLQIMYRKGKRSER